MFICKFSGIRFLWSFMIPFWLSKLTKLESDQRGKRCTLKQIQISFILHKLMKDKILLKEIFPCSMSPKSFMIWPILADCGVTVGQLLEMSALPIVPQLIACQKWPSVGPPRIYRSYTNPLPSNNGPRKLFSIGTKLLFFLLVH